MQDLSILTSIGVVALACVVGGCNGDPGQTGGPDFTQPGGAEVEDNWFDTRNPIRISLRVRADITEVVECGDSLNVYSDIGAPGYDCETSLSPLYASVLLDLETQWDRINCEEECSRNPYIYHHRGSCDESDASIVIFSTVECVGEGQTATTGLPPRDPSPILSPFLETLPPVPDSPIVPPADFGIYTTLPDPGFPGNLRCPDGSVFIFTSKKVNSCNNINYEPQVIETRQKAQEVWDDFSCGSQCSKKPLLEAGLTWNCEEPVVPELSEQAEIRLFGEIPCDQAQ